MLLQYCEIWNWKSRHQSVDRPIHILFEIYDTSIIRWLLPRAENILIFRAEMNIIGYPLNVESIYVTNNGVDVSICDATSNQIA